MLHYVCKHQFNSAIDQSILHCMLLICISTFVFPLNTLNKNIIDFETMIDLVSLKYWLNWFSYQFGNVRIWFSSFGSIDLIENRFNFRYFKILLKNAASYFLVNKKLQLFGRAAWISRRIDFQVGKSLPITKYEFMRFIWIVNQHHLTAWRCHLVVHTHKYKSFSFDVNSTRAGIRVSRWESELLYEERMREKKKRRNLLCSRVSEKSEWTNEHNWTINTEWTNMDWKEEKNFSDSCLYALTRDN